MTKNKLLKLLDKQSALNKADHISSGCLKGFIGGWVCTEACPVRVRVTNKKKVRND